MRDLLFRRWSLCHDVTVTMDVLLLSTYELGHQPLGLARPAAQLSASGHHVTCADLSVEHLPRRAVRNADLVAISIPMHTATRLGVRLAERVRSLNPRAHLSFYGLYASLNAETLLERFADSVVGGEFEAPLVDLADRLEHGQAADGLGVQTSLGGEVFLGRQAFGLPRRELLPPLERYARMDDGTRQKLAGYVEASRGCAHRCLHCPITPVYGGRMRIVPAEVVIEDIRRLVNDLGAEHITFGDPDFFNGVKHSLAIVEALHAEFPHVTYDATIKVEHLLEHRDLLARLKASGCVFVVSAVESIDESVLANLRKGHTAADVASALTLVREAGLVLRPTFVPFTPWTDLRGYLDLLEFIEEHDLIASVDPVQLAVRLLVPRGSSLIGTPAMLGVLGDFDPTTFTYTWHHSDPRVDALQLEVAALVEAAAKDSPDPVEVFARIQDKARASLGLLPSARSPRLPSEPVPRLTEPWFC
jgi:radical SAM superfamily enzyme YgiQ (UPF0313 family)